MDPSNENQLVSLKFKTRNELLDCVRVFCSKKGYALSILHSKAEKYVTLKCDRGGRFRSTHNHSNSNDQRNKQFTTTRLIECPFRLYGKKQEEGKWTIEIKNNSHNHEPSNDISGHPSLRRLADTELQAVKHMTNAGIQPRQILSSLRQSNPTTLAIAKTIYNARRKIQKDNLKGKSMIQILCEELGRGGFKFNLLQDEVGHITHFFFSHPQSIMLARNFPHVFVMDCTYKTNKYKMPLLDIVGITSFNTTFYSGFVFLKKETTEYYVWALQMFKKTLQHENQPSVIITDREQALMNAISIVFPSATNLLCIWHINKNITAKCKPYFETKENWDEFESDWRTVVYSSSLENYVDNWQRFESIYKEKRAALAYIKKTWLPLKEKFVSAWTERYLHVRNRVSSRAEGAHNKLKMYLQVSTGDLQTVKKKICLAIENQFNEIKVQLAREKHQVPHDCNTPFFRNLIYNISLFALKELHKQYEMAKTGTMHPICTGHFKATMGMPCAHHMENWKTGSISLDQIHPQWRIDNRELNNFDSNSSAHNEDQIDNILDNFRREYETWPLDKKNWAKEKIHQITNQSDVHFEPTIASRDNRFQVAKKRKVKSSTRRDPSHFEIVEARWQSSFSNGVTHASQMHQETSITTAEFEVPASISDDGVIDWIDLNM